MEIVNAVNGGLFRTAMKAIHRSEGLREEEQLEVLCALCQSGWAEGVKAFLARYSNNTRQLARAGTTTPLHVAALFGKESCVHLLIRHGFQMVPDAEGRLPLHTAAINGHPTGKSCPPPAVYASPQSPQAPQALYAYPQSVTCSSRASPRPSGSTKTSTAGHRYRSPRTPRAKTSSTASTPATKTPSPLSEPSTPSSPPPTPKPWNTS